MCDHTNGLFVLPRRHCAGIALAQSRLDANGRDVPGTRISRARIRENVSASSLRGPTTVEADASFATEKESPSSAPLVVAGPMSSARRSGA